MSQYYYDVIIAGQSLAATIAGALLARGGCRVLSFAAPPERPTAWFLSSLHLEKLLEGMGGRSCFAPPLPFQVLTDQVRLEVLGSRPLEEEFRREFPENFTPVAAFFQDLQALGQRLEETLWHAGGLPLFGLPSRFRFARKGFGKNLSLRELAKPLSSRWTDIQHTATRQALETLFAGLALADPSRLTLAEGALLWNSANRPDGVSPMALLEFLQRRYDQFHGATEDPAKLRPLECQGDRITGLSIKEGTRCTAGHFIVGDPAMLEFFPQKIAARVLPPRQPVRMSSVGLQGGISPLLASRVILEGSTPLRLEIESSRQQALATIEHGSANGTQDLTPQALQQRLSLALPFASANLDDLSSAKAGRPEEKTEERRQAGFPGAANRMQLGKNSWFCHGASIFPRLGTTGEVLVGVATANHLLRLIKHKT